MGKKIASIATILYQVAFKQALPLFFKEGSGEITKEIIPLNPPLEKGESKSKFIFKCNLVLIVIILTLITSANADETQESLPEVHGFLLGLLTMRTTGEQPASGDDGDYVIGEERLRLEVIGAGSDDALFLIKSDVFHDSIYDVTKVELKEAYISYTSGDINLRFGRQVVTWGVGDLFFINDVFPKDWESFFGGRPMEYMKLGVDGGRAIYSSDVISAEFIVAPFFTPDMLPSADRFVFFNPFSEVQNYEREEPKTTYSNAEIALRLYRPVASADVSLYAYRGFYRAPSMRLDDPMAPTLVTEFYPELSVYGASMQSNLLGGVMSLEAGYLQSREDNSGNDPTIPNAQWRILAGYQREWWTDFTAGIQGYTEIMEDYKNYKDTLPSGNPLQDRLRWVLSTRLTQWLSYQTWKLSAFFAYSPSDADYFVQPEIAHKITDSFSVSAGGNIFSGKEETTFFGQFDKSDNLFVSARLDF